MAVWPLRGPRAHRAATGRAQVERLPFSSQLVGAHSPAAGPRAQDDNMPSSQPAGGAGIGAGFGARARTATPSPDLPRPETAFFGR